MPGQCEKPTVTEVCLESMTVNWEEPKYDGGSPITGYIIEKKETTAKRWSRVNREPIRALPLGNNWDVTGLLEGAMYQFRVIAVNAAGCGLPSVPSDPVLCRDPISKKQFPLPKIWIQRFQSEMLMENLLFVCVCDGQNLPDRLLQR